MNKALLAIPFFTLMLCAPLAHAADDTPQPAAASDTPDVTPVDPNEAARLKQQQDYIKSQQQVARQAMTTPPGMSKMFDAQQDLLNRAHQDAQKQEELMDKSIENQKRFSKILDKWEVQQTQYQKYLDSLPTSKRNME